MTTRADNAKTLDQLRALADAKTVVPESEYAPHLTEWRGRWEGRTPLILAPASPEELSGLMGFAYEQNLAMVPQGGNTGLVGGQVPFGEVLFLMNRMRTIRDISAQGYSMTVEAGLTLAEAQQAAAKADRLFPLSIGSEGSCQIGGVLSTNAGGVNVIRHGNARDQVLGIEAVLPDGRVWNGLNSLRKNNVGYDMKHLMIGGEGTLGIITAATLKLAPRPVETSTCLLAVPTAQAAVELLSRAQDISGGQVSSFELMNDMTMSIVVDAFPALNNPLGAPAPFYCLIEFSAGRPGSLDAMVMSFVESAMSDDLTTDGTIAINQGQAAQLWSIRHNASEAMKKDAAYCVKCDISVPIAQVPAFLGEAEKAVLVAFPRARIVAFGHLGDGNIHFDVLGPQGEDQSGFRAHAGATERLVHDIAIAHGGSISAEHGIGILKRDELVERKDATELFLMRQIKDAFDPKGLMNPGKLLTVSETTKKSP